MPDFDQQSEPNPQSTEGQTLVDWFKKKAKADNQPESQAPDTEAVQSDPKKARRFFEHAKTVADARNYDYAIECYINGLRHEPNALTQHEALRDVALRRKVGGGKPAGMIESMKRGGGKTIIDKMLNAEYLWSKDPLNATHAIETMEHAVKAGLMEVGYWIGDLAMEAAKATKKPSKAQYISIRNLYTEIGAYDKAVDACRVALAIDPQDMQLVRELHDLEAEKTMMQGRYDEDSGFQKAVVNMDRQKELANEDAIARTDSAKEDRITRARAIYEDNPDDVDALQKLVRALLDLETEQAEGQAVDILNDAFNRFGQYRFKTQIGDVKIKQYNRKLRQLQHQLKDNPGDEQLKQQIHKLASQQVRFELEEYGDRVKNYPTDMGLRFQFGRRQLAVRDFDAAIASFQESRADPKHRAPSLRYLGEAFAAKEWFDEAIDTFREGIEIYPNQDDRLGLALRYDLMNALQRKGQRDKNLEIIEEAAKIASGIAQTDINYQDIRDRLNALRNMVAEMRSNAN